MTLASAALRSIADVRASNHDLGKDRFWGRLLREVGRSSVAKAEDKEQLEDYLFRGFEIVECLAYALNPSPSAYETQALVGWHHHDHPDLVSKKPGDPQVPRMEIENAAGDYLRLSYRVDALDRMLVDLLIALEMFAFADEMQSVLKRKSSPILKWLGGNALTLIIGLSIAAFAVWVAPVSTIAAWFAGVVTVITVGGTIWSLVAFPLAYLTFRRERQKIIAIVSGMRNAYVSLKGSPASVRHIQERVQRAIDLGVVWPAPLMALLDDIGDRRRTI